MKIVKATQEFDVTVEGRDSKDNVAAFENPLFAVSPPELGTFVVDPTNPAAGTFKANQVGSGQLSFIADGIVGEGERLITAAEDITVTPGDAVAVVINTGAVRDQQ